MFAVAGCAGGIGGTSPSPSAAAPATSGPAGGPVAACAVGDWQSTEVKFAASGPFGSGSVTGGKNVTVRIAANGTAEVDFTGMEAIGFAGVVMGTSIKGSLAHSGRAAGQIRTGDATSMSGTWEPVGKTDFSAVRVTLDLAEPVKIKPFDNVPIGSVMNSSPGQAPGVVDSDPLLGKGKYECGTGTLTLTSEDGTGFAWKLIRKP